ncbi:MAG: hypothetical protein N3E41_08835 [Thermofilaceae archaeon]|nr:hypothetical protein [Thermofilaceae archaeon]
MSALGPRITFNSFPVASSDLYSRVDVKKIYFQFFPSCCSTHRSLSLTFSLIAFNSFPVAVLR